MFLARDLQCNKSEFYKTEGREMKKFSLALIFVSFITCSLSSITSASQNIILSCQIVPNDIQNDIQSINTDDQPVYKIVVISFSENDTGLITLQDYRKRSCIEMLAKLVKNERFEIKGVSSPDNETAYTLLQKN